jgi:nucleolar complex protein 2
VLVEGLVEESAYLLADWLASRAVQGSIAYPEIIIPVVVALRKVLKSLKSGNASGASGKDVTVVKGLVERIEESSKWVEQSRKTVQLVPGRMAEVQDWERQLKGKVDESPLGKYMLVQRKAREKRRKLVEKVCISASDVYATKTHFLV